MLKASNYLLLRRIGLAVMIFLSICISMYAFAFQLQLIGDPSFHVRFDQVPIQAAMHVLGGGTVLLIGGFQFSTSLRRNRPQLHRLLGRTYLLLVLVGGIGGLMLAPSSAGGLVAHYGFGLLAVLWLFSGWQAYACIRRGDVRSHQAWMMRNFALTFGAVMLRVYLGMFTAAGISFEDSYPVTAWISWVPNLILIEWYLALKARPPRSQADFRDPPMMRRAEPIAD